MNKTNKKVTSETVKEAVNKLLERKEIVSSRSVRDEIGFGSFSTISKHLKDISDKVDFTSVYDNKVYFSETLDNISKQVSSLSQLVNPRVKSRSEYKLFLLIYKSIAGPNCKSREIINEIKTTSILHNAKHGISGLLLFNENHFLQILEGESYDLLNLYQKIIENDGTKKTKLLWFVQMDDKLFPDLTMLTSEMHPEVFNQCSKLLTNSKKCDIKFISANLQWMTELARSYLKSI